MCHLHVSVVLLCSAYRALSCSLLFQGSFSAIFAHIICGTVCRYVIIVQLRCLDFFLTVVGLVDVFFFSVHRSAGSCGERTFLVLTIVGLLF